ncbi:DUF488 family protein [Streptomyces lydicus]|nr:DUF488 family protein [Streptomyces lydicus]
MGEKFPASALRVRRVYEAPEPADGARVLVDRLWPRGLSKADAQLSEWCKDVAPSSELRRWFHHEGPRFAEFAERYREELAREAARRRWRAAGAGRAGAADAADGHQGCVGEPCERLDRGAARGGLTAPPRRRPAR